MCTDGLRHDGGPVGRREVLGVLDVVGAVLHVPVAVRDVDLQQVLDAVFQVAAEMMRKLQLHAPHHARTAPPQLLRHPAALPAISVGGPKFRDSRGMEVPTAGTGTSVTQCGPRARYHTVHVHHHLNTKPHEFRI